MSRTDLEPASLELRILEAVQDARIGCGMHGIDIDYFPEYNVVRGYTWPNPKLDTLESARWDQDGWGPGTIFASGLTPCDTFEQDQRAGRANAADWLRTAYHDMATHNVEDGTGGLDASIRFREEQARGENAGDGFDNTLEFIRPGRHLSLADGIALAALVAVEHCGGPQIDFRGGRVDADAPNAPGVPQPHEPIESHVSSFAKQGFNQTEMIALVACGHTFGGVQRTAFPTIAPELNDPDNKESNARFDSTFVHFDNKVATEYIDGTTANPLVVGHNETTRSDLRIFSSDNNATMASFAKSEELFMSTCAQLFARMLDTVPRGVQLSEVLEPVPVKPKATLEYMGNGTLHLRGYVRLWELPEDPARIVKLHWTDRDGQSAEGNTAVMGHTEEMMSTALGGRRWGLWYSFNKTSEPDFLVLDAERSIGKMSFEFDGRVEDQGGVGFALQDTLMWANSTCKMDDLDEYEMPYKVRVDIAIRRGVNPSRVWIEEDIPLDFADAKPEVIVIPVPPPTPGGAAADAYEVWTVEIQTYNTLTALVEVDGKVLETTDTRKLDDLPFCGKA